MPALAQALAASQADEHLRRLSCDEECAKWWPAADSGTVIDVDDESSLSSFA
jgi:hypothetical protein